MNVAYGSEILRKEGDSSPTDAFIEATRVFDWKILPTISAFAMPSGSGALPDEASVPIFGVLDLHANVGARMCALADGLLTYRMNPRFSFADTRYAGVSSSVVSDAVFEIVRPHLQAGAELAWMLRDSGTIRYPTVESVLANIKASSDGARLLVESADNIGAGAPGDGTAVLRALIAYRADRALVALCDARAVEQLAQIPIGARTRLSLGGCGWPSDPGPLESDVTLISRRGGAFQFEDSQNHLAAAYGAGFDMGPCAVVRTAGATLLLTTHRTPRSTSGSFGCCVALSIRLTRSIRRHRRTFRRTIG